MVKTTFTAAQLEAAINRLETADKDFPLYPLLVNTNWQDIWDENFFPKTFRKIGDDEVVRVDQKEYFGGEEGGDHAMFVILQVGYGKDARYFKKMGEYNSWDDSNWYGAFFEVVSQEVKKTEWVMVQK